jgi:hypothetical protein
MALTTEQRVFLLRHKISLSQVFDATGMSTQQYKGAMKRQEKLFAFGTARCLRGHELRSRAGNCIQCDTANISFMKNSVKRASVYIAASRSKQCVKVGMTGFIEAREEQLRKYQYGGADDWIMVSSVVCNNAGRVEFQTHSKLADYKIQAFYQWEGRHTECHEIFRCGYFPAHRALIEFLTDDERALLLMNMRRDAGKNYNFS